MSDHGYQLLPLATSQLVGTHTEFEVLGIFSPVLLNVGGRELITIEDPSIRSHSYQLLLIATSHKVGDNREFDASSIL